MRSLLTLILIGTFLSRTSTSQSSDWKPEHDPIRVHLLGTFHFSQASGYEILSPEVQAEIEELCGRIAETDSDCVFLEAQPDFEDENRIQERYETYLAGEAQLGRNEIGQVGFRSARKLGLDRIHLCDHPGSWGFVYGEALAYAESTGDVARLLGDHPRGVTSIESRTDETALQAELGLLDYLRWLNHPEVQRSSHAGYVTNYPSVGSTNWTDGDDESVLIGARVLADWYQRNIFIYSKILQQLSYGEDAILVLIGNDHVPILRELFLANPNFEVVPAAAWL